MLFLIVSHALFSPYNTSVLSYHIDVVMRRSIWFPVTCNKDKRFLNSLEIHYFIMITDLPASAMETYLLYHCQNVLIYIWYLYDPCYSAHPSGIVTRVRQVQHGAIMSNDLSNYQKYFCTISLEIIDWKWNIMMTKSNGNIFRVTGHCCG